MADNKIRVSYLAIIVYTITILLALLLVTLLPSLSGVKRGDCDKDAVVKSEIKENPSIKTKRDVKTISDYEEKMTRLKQHEMRPPYLRYFKDIPYCTDLEETAAGNPWGNERLPTNIYPLRYDIEFYTPIISAEIYNGEVTMSLRITEDIDTIVVHANLINVFLPFLNDSADNQLEIKCTNYYKKNEYFVIKTANKIRQSQGPLKLRLYFNGFLNIYESGIFAITYDKDEEELDG